MTSQGRRLIPSVEDDGRQGVAKDGDSGGDRTLPSSSRVRRRATTRIIETTFFGARDVALTVRRP